VRRIVIAALVLAVVVAGAAFAARATVLSCGPDNPLERIGIFQRTSQNPMSFAQLPSRSGWPPGRPAVVVDLPPFGTCPAYDPDQTDMPMTIWLRLGPDSYAGYGRTGGGP
jgi:hypothetical protein